MKLRSQKTGIDIRPLPQRLRRAATTLPLLLLSSIFPCLHAQETKPEQQEVASDKGFGMAPPATPDVIAEALKLIKKPLPPGPFQPTWESVKTHYKDPSWFEDAKFGIFMHWGPYAVPAHHNEWYEKHMYGAFTKWHIENFGPHDKFGYKDFLPLFTAEKYNADEWAALFKASGARYVMPTAQHHDNFALWDSEVTPFNSKKIGAKRDLIGELAVASRKQGLKFAVSNHGIENFTFIRAPRELIADLKGKNADLFDPKWADFYNVADRSPAATARFLADWVDRNDELIDKYQIDMLWFDNGVNHRVYDPLKVRVAAYYYNRAQEWGKEVAISTKQKAYAPSEDETRQIGSIIDFEKIGHRSPPGLRLPPWQVDDPIGTTWGYTSNMKVFGSGVILPKLIDTVSKGGNYLLNISPKADGTIPDEQQKTLRDIGAWLETNGEAIYGTRSWHKFGEGEKGGQNYRFTLKGDTLYAIALGWPKGDEAMIASLASGSPGKVSKVELLGANGDLSFSQDAAGLHIKLPPKPASAPAYTFKITGLQF